MTRSTKGPADALESLLDTTRHLLLGGEIDQLPRVGQGIDRALNALLVNAEDAAVLTSIRNRAQQNATLLEAAHAGLRAAFARQRELSAARTSLSTYTKDGDRQVQGGQSTFERRS